MLMPLPVNKWLTYLKSVFSPGVSNSKCSEGLIRTNKVTRGPHCDTDAIMAGPERYQEQLLHLIACERYRELLENNF